MTNSTSSQTTQKMTNKFWEFRNQANSQSAELLLYGDISQSSWWGDEVTPKQFADDLAGLGDVDEITVRINSSGGDVFAADAIGNQLEQHPANVVAKIDGLCASAATIVACHADKVIAANDAIYMVHPVRMGICDYMDATELNNCLKALNTIRESIVGLYAKKTGREKDEVARWMDETNWWTSEQAKENGFVDELVNAEESAVVENRSGMLFVNGIGMHLPFDKAPDFVRNRPKAKDALGGFDNTTPAGKPGADNHEEANMEIKTTDALHAAYPELVDQIVKEATEAERTRIKEIEDMALPGSDEITNEAKFTKPMTASAYAVAVMKHTKAQGGKYMEQMEQDAKDSGANDVPSAPPADTKPKDKANNGIIDAIRRANGVK